MDQKEVLAKYGNRVGYSAQDLEKLTPGDPRTRHLENVSKAAPNYSIVAEVLQARHCNTGYKPGDRIIMDVDGNLISKLCPKRLCVYLLSQFTLPVALINERLSENLEPNAFHFAHQVSCPDVGVDCGGYGNVVVEISAKARE